MCQDLFDGKNSKGAVLSPLSFSLDQVTNRNEVYGELLEVILLLDDLSG